MRYNYPVFPLRPFHELSPQQPAAFSVPSEVAALLGGFSDHLWDLVVGLQSVI